MLSRDAVIDAV